MRQTVCLLSALLLGEATLAASHHAKTEMVNFKSGDETVSGFLAAPTAAGRHPAIVVIQEWWGLNDWVKEQAQKFAEEGYVTLAPDLYRGKVATDPSEAHQLVQDMPHERAMRDLKAAFAYLAARPDVLPDKIGSVGWCMGGGLSVALATSEPKLAASAVYYGSLPTDPAEIAKIQAPVLGNFGGEDRGPSPDSVRAFEAAMKVANKSIDAKLYEGAGHAFQNPNNKRGYHPQAAADAWQRTLAFFKRTLKS